MKLLTALLHIPMTENTLRMNGTITCDFRILLNIAKLLERSHPVYIVCGPNLGWMVPFFLITMKSVRH